MIRNLSRRIGHGVALAAGSIAIFAFAWVRPAPAQFVLATNNSAITITSYNGPGGTVVIPAFTNGFPVVNIESNAFINQSNITSVLIPNGVAGIGNLAFHYCVSLSSITLPNTVTNLGKAVFSGCLQLANATLSTNLAIIPGNTFAGCTNLSSVAIPDSVCRIGIEAFALTRLTNVVIPNSVTNLEDDDSVGDVFVRCQELVSVTLPNTISSIPIGTFANCSKLANVRIPETVKLIGYGAFFQCASLTNISIPSGVTNLDRQAFEQCTNLIGAYFLGSQPDPGTNITVFAGNPTVAYYLPGKTGWGSTYDGIPAVLWNPQAHTFKSANGQFGFQITGPANATVVVMTCTNLSSRPWVPLSTNILSSSGGSEFNAPEETAVHPTRFYGFSPP